MTIYSLLGKILRSIARDRTKICLFPLSYVPMPPVAPATPYLDEPLDPEDFEIAVQASRWSTSPAAAALGAAGARPVAASDALRQRRGLVPAMRILYSERFASPLHGSSPARGRAGQLRPVLSRRADRRSR